MTRKLIGSGRPVEASLRPHAACARRSKPATHTPLFTEAQTVPEADARVLTVAAAVLEEASRAGLLDSPTEHVSCRAPKPLLDAAKRETGLMSTTEPGLVALAALARPDPLSVAMKRTRGKLGTPHTLEY